MASENLTPDRKCPSSSQSGATGQLPAPLERALEQAYQAVEAEVRSLGVGCWVRGDCCDFERCDHRLYASSVEIAYAKEKHPRPFPPGSVLCPFWVQGKCTERERRPLGCRTYFCDRRYRDQLEALYEKHFRRLQALAGEERFPWVYEPFVEAMRRPAPEAERAVAASDRSARDTEAGA